LLASGDYSVLKPVPGASGVTRRGIGIRRLHPDGRRPIIRRRRLGPRPGEEVENLLVPVAEAVAMVRDGRITDSKTVAAILYWERFIKGDG
jgi:hypothetical protein